MPDFSSPAFVKALLAVAAIFVIVAGLDAAQTLIAPVAAALVTGVVFGPLTDAFERRGLPGAAAASVVLILLACMGGAIFMALEPAISRAILNGPMIWAEMGDVVDFLRGALSGVQELQEQMADAMTTEAESLANDGDDEQAQMPVPSVMDALSYGPSLLAGMLLYVATLYFFLATRMSSYRGISRLFPGATPDLLVAAEQRVSRYFLAITIVNSGFGTLTFLAMSLLGMPQPVLWGLAVFLANFILYLGPAMVAIALLVVGIVTFDGVMSFVPMVVFVTMNMIEAQFVTPTFVGRQMSLNPLLVFLSLAVWLWLWGPIGGLIAIPALVWFLFMLGQQPEPAAAQAQDADRTVA
jgi:predicted PurR-regulated permease PerM